MQENALRRTAPRYRIAPDTAELTATLTEATKDSERAGSNLNDYLQKIVTLDAALIGGGFLLAKGDVLPYGWNLAVLVTLALSLAAALFGLYPRKGVFNFGSTDGLRAYRKWDRWVSERKGTCMNIAASALLAAFVVGIAGIAAQGPKQPAATSETK